MAHPEAGAFYRPGALLMAQQALTALIVWLATVVVLRLVAAAAATAQTRLRMIREAKAPLRRALAANEAAFGFDAADVRLLTCPTATATRSLPRRRRYGPLAPTTRPTTRHFVWSNRSRSGIKASDTRVVVPRAAAAAALPLAGRAVVEAASLLGSAADGRAAVLGESHPDAMLSRSRSARALKLLPRI